MSVPAQFQLRDLVNHLMVGMVVLLVVAVALGLPTLTKLRVFDLSLLPKDAGTRVLLAVAAAYAIGSSFPSTTRWRRSLVLKRGEGTRLQRARTRIYCWLTASGSTDPTAEAFARLGSDRSLMLCFDRAVERTFGSTADFPPRTAEVFELCRSWLETQPITSAATDIERHYVTMHFNFKLRTIFLLAAFIGLCAVASACWYRSVVWQGVVFVLIFSTLAYFAGFTARSNEGHFHRLVIRAFAVQAGVLVQTVAAE